MRRTVLTSLVTFAFTALSIAITACATAPGVDDNLSGLEQDQKPTEPKGEEAPSAKLPAASDTPAPQQPATPVSNPPKDAGVADAKPAQDSSTPPVDSGTPTTGADCDTSNPIYYIEFISASSPASCPCSASECCYLGLGCVAK